MKKSLLTLGAALLLSAGVFAQVAPAENPTSSELSKNNLTSTKKGYYFNWEGTNTDAGVPNTYNCFTTDGAYNPFSAAGFTFGLDASKGYLKVDFTGSQSGNPVVRFQSGECATYTLADLTSGTQKIMFKVRSSVAITDFAINAAFDGGEAGLLLADSEFPKINLVANEWKTDTLTIPTKGWYGATSSNVDVDFTKILGFWLSVPAKEKGTLEFDWVAVGDAKSTDIVVINALTEAEIAALNVKVFPNPASDVVNVSYNVPADESVVVTLSNSLGQEVASVVGSSSNASIDVAGLNGGLYFASVVVDGIVVATQKVIVE